MSAVLKICGVILLGLFASLILRDRSKTVVVICAFVTVMVFCTENGLLCAVDTLKTMTVEAPSEIVSVLLKAGGIGIITAVTSEICTSAGENSLGAAAVFAGKTEIILLSLPLLSRLLSIAGDAL